MHKLVKGLLTAPLLSDEVQHGSAVDRLEAVCGLAAEVAQPFRLLVDGLRHVAAQGRGPVKRKEEQAILEIVAMPPAEGCKLIYTATKGGRKG